MKASAAFSPRSFQFTHPGRGATSQAVVRWSKYRVSIHAPREGCDYAFRKPVANEVMFQFTHPGRGATCSDSFR